MRSRGLMFVALALSLASPAAALNTQLGPIAGFSFSNLRIEGQSDIEGTSSFAAGGVVDLGFNDQFGIRIEPTWVTKGAKATHRNAYWGTIDGAVFKLDYIDVPVLARYDLATTESRGYLLGGVGVGFATQQQVELSQANNGQTVDLGDVFSPIDVTANLGAGLSYAAGANRITVDGRVGYGLMNINDGGTVTFNGIPLPVPSTSTHTLEFRLLMSYLFPISHK